MIHEKYQKLMDSLEQTKYPQMIRAEGRIALYECDICGYVYDPAIGDTEGGIRAGIPFEELPDNWRCPVCGAPKKRFCRK